jgi:hypothetical protein
MSRFRFRILLLSLGVLFGYGSAFARYHTTGSLQGRPGWCEHADRHWTRDRGQSGPKPEAPRSRAQNPVH